MLGVLDGAIEVLQIRKGKGVALRRFEQDRTRDADPEHAVVELGLHRFEDVPRSYQSLRNGDYAKLPEAPTGLKGIGIVAVEVTLKLRYDRRLAVLLPAKSLALDLNEEIVHAAGRTGQGELRIRMDAALCLEVILPPAEAEADFLALRLEQDMEIGYFEFMIDSAERMVIERFSSKFLRTLVSQPVDIRGAAIVHVRKLDAADPSGGSREFKGPI